MKFEIIDNRELDLAGKGYKWVNELSQFDQAVLDDIRRTRGDNYADGLSDDLLYGYSPICRGDDGELYSVLFDFGGDVPRPVLWSKVERVDFDYGCIIVKPRFSISRPLSDYSAKKAVLTKCLRTGIEFKIIDRQLIVEMQIVYKDVNEKLKCSCLNLHDWTCSIAHLGDMRCDL